MNIKSNSHYRSWFVVKKFSQIKEISFVSYASPPIQKLHLCGEVTSKYTSLPSTVATFLTTHLMVVLQLSRYSIFHSRDTSIQLSLPWQSYSCQCLNTETFAWGNRSFTTETMSISYTISLYIRLIVTL